MRRADRATGSIGEAEPAVLLSLPTLLRVRVGRRVAPPAASELDGPEAPGAWLGRLLPPLELDLLLIERLELAPARDAACPDASGVPLRPQLVGLLEGSEASVPPAALAEAILGPAARIGSERSLVLELAARVAAMGEPRWLQVRALHELGEVLASPPVAAELAAAGFPAVGGPGPPVFDDRGRLLTRV